MKKNAKGTNANTAADAQVAWAINISRSDGDVWHSVLLAVFSDDLVLFDFGEAISISHGMGSGFGRARFVQYSSMILLPIAIHRERADIDESLQGLRQKARLDEVASGDYRVHEGIGKGLFTSAGGQVENDSDIFRCFCAVLAREQIASNYVKSRSTVALREHLEFRYVAGGPRETPQITETPLEQALNDFRSDKAAGPGYEDWVFGTDDKSRSF